MGKDIEGKRQNVSLNKFYSGHFLFNKLSVSLQP